VPSLYSRDADPEGLLQKDTVRVYTFEMMQQVDKGLWMLTQRAFDHSEEWNADLILIHMNTYGGLVDMADSIRTKILNYHKPVWVFIDNNAASAGALISISCDSIYMRPGGNIGAATVVNQTGEEVPDKFQSYMRSTMRSTAEAQGMDTVFINGEWKYTWRRDPRIAEAMVDPSISVPEVSDTGKVLTFTTREAINWGFCEGEAATIEEVIENSGIQNYVLKEYKSTPIEKFLRLLLSPGIQGILILLIIGGIYFELQSPGVGFPLAASVLGALLYFAPLYLEGLAANWEVLVFIAGVGLLLVEMFAIPGFGIAGIGGIILMIVGLSLSLIDNVIFDFSNVPFIDIFKAFTLVTFSFFISLIISIWAASRLLTSAPLSFLALQADQKQSEGYVSADESTINLVGKEGEAYSILRPSGKVIIDGVVYDAVAETSWIERGAKVKVVRRETTQIYVQKI
jgi:membrane-bound serine protease (ClpP class)